MSSLPKHVYAIKDRHGKTRYRFNRKGWKSAYLHGEPGSAEFYREYAEIIETGEIAREPVKSLRTVKEKSIEDAYQRLRQSTRWRKKAAKTQLVQGRLLDRFMDKVSKDGNRYGDRPIDKVTVGWLDTILGLMWETPAAANVLRKNLSGVMDYAIKLGWRTDNPVRLTDSYPEGEGHHDWTDAEIEKYRKRHPLGTMARLTLELALNTAARRCDVNKIERDHIIGGEIVVDHSKGNNEATVPMLATTKAALDALPATPFKFLITTQHGNPFTDNGMGNKMRQWCDEAGLPHCSMHGLRKAMSRQLAESGASDAEGQAVTGHKKDSTFAYYRAKANRRTLAARAVANLGSLAGCQPTESVEDTDV